MRDAHDAMRDTADAGGAAIAARLREAPMREQLVERTHQARRRRVAGQTALTLILALAIGVGATWALPAILDNEPATESTRIEQVAPLDPGINADAPEIFPCGVVPGDVPAPGAAYAGAEHQPTLETVVLARQADPDFAGVADAAVPLDGSVAVDPRASLHVAFHVLWGDQQPERWGVYTAGAVVDAAGAVVMPHPGTLVRTDSIPVQERRRAFEGGFDPYACGDGEPAVLEGEYELVWLVQVWVDEPASVVATFVNAGLPDPASVVLEPGAGIIELTDQEQAARARAAMRAQIEASGMPVADAVVGYRPSARPFDAEAGTPVSCPRVVTARAGLDAVEVSASGQRPDGLVTGGVPKLEGPFGDGGSAVDEFVGRTGLALGFAFPATEAESAWASAVMPVTLLLFDAEGRLAAAREGDAELWSTAVDADRSVYFRAFPRATGCDVPGTVAAAGTYTPVYVAGIVALPGVSALPDGSEDVDLEGWIVLPPVELDAHGEAADAGVPRGPYTATVVDGYGPSGVTYEGH